MARSGMKVVWVFLVCGTLAAAAAHVMADGNFSGAIWTTLSDGSEVDGNNFAAKEDVYLNGGPGAGAGSNAPGIPDGVYIFMVTDPSGKTLLSTDIAACRQVTVSGGVFAGSVNDCHKDGATIGGSVPVQLMPYNDSPNNGDEYKAWLTPASSYQCPLNQVSCGQETFGFIDSQSKTDNFKVKIPEFQEIDTIFTSAAGQQLDGLRVVWIDTLKASNVKWSYTNPTINVFHRAHVEHVEVGTHYIVLDNQPGCTIGRVWTDDGTKATVMKNYGPQTVPVKITQAMKNGGNFTVTVNIYCQ